MRVGAGLIVLAALVGAPAAAPPASTAPCAGTDACLRELAAGQAQTRSLDARFLQTKHVSLLDEPLVSRGRFRFRAPDHVRLDVEAPQPATILIAGRAVTIPGLPAGEQRALAAGPMVAMFSELGALLAGRLTAASAHFDVAARGDADGIEVTLRPTAPDQQRLFRTIVLRFAGSPPQIRAMRLDDGLGDRLDVELRDVARNVELPDALFTQP